MTVVYALIFILVLSILILVHELGHFFVAKRAGIWVEEFGFGIPPRLFGKKIGETIYSVNVLPFGGFVRLHGENSEEDVTKPQRAFVNKSIKTRVAIIVAGVVMNFILAVIAFATYYTFSGVPKIKVLEVRDNSPAQEAGLNAGGLIDKVDGKKVSSMQDFVNYVDSHAGNEVVLDISRDGKSSSVSLTPRVDPPEGEGAIGVILTVVPVFPPVWQRPFLGIYYGFKDAFYWGYLIIVGLGQLFIQLFSGNVPQDLAGPVGIFALTSEAAKFGVLSVINFMGVLSVNLAILNIFPFPALDGGRLFFIVIEAIIGKKITDKTENLIHTLGMAILITLILAITYHDISRLISSGGISGYIDSFLSQ
jgi:regulator of sigma E protease